MSGQDWLDKDFYATLGVDKKADDATIKKAYRKLARTWHPDQNKGDVAAENKFKEIGEAYAVLSDPEQRKQYDALRAMAGGGARFAGGAGGAGAGFDDLFGGFGGGNVRFSTSGGAPFDMGNLSDMLSGMFGGGGGHAGFGGNTPFGGGSPFGGAGAGGARAQAPTRGEDITASAHISLPHALTGGTVSVSAEGTRHTVKVPQGVKDGQKLRLRGKGRPSPAGGAAGDLMVTIHVDPHPVYTREGDNLRMTLPVTFVEATLGAQVEVPLIDGSHVTMKIPAGTQPETALRLRGRGVTTSSKTGDLLVNISVAVPRDLTEDERQAVSDLAEHVALGDPRRDLTDTLRGTA